MSSEIDLQQVLPAWLELTSKTDASLGLEPSEAYGRAKLLLRNLREGRAAVEGWTPDTDHVEVLHALVALVLRVETRDPRTALSDIDLVFKHIEALPWSTDLGGPDGLVSDCALQGWLVARPFAAWPEVAKWESRVRGSADTQVRAARVLSLPIPERKTRAQELGLLDPRLLLCVCDPPRVECNPLVLREEAAFFYDLIDGTEPCVDQQDEREFFLGEFALTAGSASRFLLRTADAKEWLQRADAHFILVENTEAQKARVDYQRLALLMEARQVDEVLEMSQDLIARFRQLQMAEDALKCRFIEGIANYERGDAARAIEIYTAICAEAESLHSPRFLAIATSNLVTFLVETDEIERALGCARRALPLLQQLDSRVHLAKLQWGMGNLLRKQGKRTQAVETYRQALREATELGIRGDIAAIHLVIADLLVEAGDDAQAELEIRAALPIIEKEKMVPEGIAALSLLRESLRHRQIDRRALRDLHRELEDRKR